MDQISNNRIMIIGGDAHFLYLIQRYVRRSAHPIITANPGGDWVSLAKREKPAVIILEVDSPETIGWRILQTLMADPALKEIPVIICSWLDEEERGLAEGATTYLRMPILYEDFKMTLDITLMREAYE